MFLVTLLYNNSNDKQIIMNNKKHQAHIPPGCTGSLSSQSVEVSSSPCVWEVQPVSGQYDHPLNCLFSCLVSSVGNRDWSWGNTGWRWICCWGRSWWQSRLVGGAGLLLSWRLGPRVPLGGGGLEVVRVVWGPGILLLVRCVAFSWLLLRIDQCLVV